MKPLAKFHLMFALAFSVPLSGAADESQMVTLEAKDGRTIRAEVVRMDKESVTVLKEKATGVVKIPLKAFSRGGLDAAIVSLSCDERYDKFENHTRWQTKERITLRESPRCEATIMAFVYPSQPPLIGIGITSYVEPIVGGLAPALALNGKPFQLAAPLVETKDFGSSTRVTIGMTPEEAAVVAAAKEVDLRIGMVSVPISQELRDLIGVLGRFISAKSKASTEGIVEDKATPVPK